MSSPIVRWLRRHDPEWYALHKAIKVSVVVTTGVAFGTLLGNPQLTLFASFGGVALLLFADFPGSRSARFGAYVGLAAVGAVLITVGTLVSLIGWLAVLGMAVVGFLVLFAGVLSAAAAAATRAALLTFILPATVPAAAAVTACCSAMPTSNQRSGKRSANGSRPVEPGIPAVTATISGRAAANSTSLSLNAAV